MLEEKKTIPALQVFGHRELAQKIAGLTEDIEELKSEKALLLNQLHCADGHGMDEIKQYVASMESSLETLNQQEEKYTTELDTALAQYTELQQQAADMDTTELDTARQAIRADKEREIVQRLQTAYGKKFDSRALDQSRKDVAKMLGEPMEQVSVRQTLQQLQEQQNRQSHVKERSQER